MDIRQVTNCKANLIKRMGVDGYLNCFLNHLKSQGLSKQEVFDAYYQVRQETIAEYSH